MYVQRRRPYTTFYEVFYPVLFVIILIALGGASSEGRTEEEVREFSRDPLIPFGPGQCAFYQRPPISEVPNCVPLAYVPRGNAEVEQVVGVMLGLPPGAMVPEVALGFDTFDDLFAFYQDPDNQGVIWGGMCTDACCDAQGCD